MAQQQLVQKTLPGVDISGNTQNAMETPTSVPTLAPTMSGSTVVRGLNIRFILDVDSYGANVFIETFGSDPQFTSKYHVVGATWMDIANAIQALLTSQASVTSTTPH